MNSLLKPLAIILTSILLGLFLVWVLDSLQGSRQVYERSSENELENFFYQQKISQSELQYKFYNEEIRILIVPGHSDEFPGTIFKEIREVDLNRKVSDNLFNFLDEDSRFNVRLLHSRETSDDEIFSYINQSNNIEEFKNSYQRLESFFNGKDKDFVVNNRIYSETEEETINFLYGMNLWLNENNFDIVIHVHFNNYLREGRNEKGEFEGFAIYVPQEKYSNGVVSKELAESIHGRLDNVLERSNLPTEEEGIVESSSLIALGSFNTLSTAALLIEYGFIYEDKFGENGDIFYEIGKETYEGILDFLK